MFGSNLKNFIETRCVAGAFGSYSAGIHRLGKEIASHQKVNFSQEIKNFLASYLFTKLTKSTPIFSKHIISASRLILSPQFAPKHHRQ
jgi:hypothetical protein